MSKYDFEIDLSEETSTGMILAKVRPGSTVLEFGCATGRMTRYMKEELGCRVYIVELERSAFDEAAAYAEGGVCGDILDYEWTRAFGEVRFDAALFVDVLEHLTDPLGVVRAVKPLLKEDGILLLSIPNVTHNDILLKAFEGRFDYTRTGLLDDTHVHFWGEENIWEFAKEAGLSVASLEATYEETGRTEQYAGEMPEKSPYFLNLFRERPGGEVYQFIVGLSREAHGDPRAHFRRPSIRSNVYPDYGNGLWEDQRLFFDTELSGDGLYRVDIHLEDTRDLKGVRFDPVESQGCILIGFSARQGERLLTPLDPDCPQVGEELLLPGPDPNLYVPLELPGEPLTLRAEVLLAGERYAERMRGYVDRLLRERDAGRTERSQLARDYEEALEALGQYRLLADRKDSMLLALERELSRERESARELHRTLEEMEARTDRLERAISDYKSSWSGRLRRFVGGSFRRKAGG